MHLRTTLLAFATIGTLLIVAACGGRDDEQKRLEDALARLAPGDLALLVLPAAELEGLAEGLELAEDSGERDNGAAAHDSLDPEDTGESLADAGRIAGYSLTYDNPNFFEALQRGEGLLSVGTSAELWTDDEAARKSIDKRLRDFTRFKGQVVDDVELVEVTEFDIEPIGDQSGGIRYAARLDDGAFDITLHATLLYVRVARVVLTAITVRADDEDTQMALEAIGGRLETRLRRVALGEITVTPIPIDNGPAEPTPATPGTPPAGTPDLGSVALRVEDLPEGFVVVEERYADPPDIEFARSFAIEGRDQYIAVGSTRVINIQNEIAVHASEAEASAFVGAVEAILSGASGADLFRALIEEQGEFTVGDVELESLPIAVGDEGVAIVGTLDAGIARFGLAFLIARVDAAVASLIVTGFAEDLAVDDLVPLLEVVTARLEQLDR
ncbi:MAG: hypothetical protein Kow0010_13530 [Dehalococcoidia bacterium]